MVAARALLLLALVTLVPGVAAAQIPGPVTPPVVTPRTPPPSTIPSAPVVLPTPTVSTVGPVQTFILRPTIAFSEEYTDNFNRTERDLVSNLRSTIAPGLLVLIDKGFLTGQASYSLSLFHDTSQDDTIGYFNSFSGRLSWEATPRLAIHATYGLSQSDEPDRADRLDLRQERQKFTAHTFSLEAIYALALIDVRPHYRFSHFSSSDETNIAHTLGVGSSLALDKIHALTAGYDYLSTETTNERPIASAGLGDSSLKGHEWTASLSRELTVRSSAGLSAAYAVRRETRRLRQSDFTRWSVSLFNNYVLPEKIILRGNIGVAQLNGDQSSGRPLLTSFSSLSYWFGPALFGLTVERGFSETFGEGENFGVVETSGISASLSYPFTPSVRASADVSYRENKFLGEGDVSRSGRAGTEETTISGTVALSVQLLRWLGSSLQYAYTDTSSSENDRNFIENRILLSFSAAF